MHEIAHVPATYRYLLHWREPMESEGVTAWQCAGCAIRTMQIGASKFITDRWTATLWMVTRQSEQRVKVQQIHRHADSQGIVPDYAFTEYSLPVHQHAGPLEPDPRPLRVSTKVTPTSFGRGAETKPAPEPKTDDLGATLTSIDRYLKEARQA